MDRINQMNKSEIQQNILMVLIVLILLGVLAFLYDETQAVDMSEQNEVISLLNEVKEIDSRWDMEVRRARIDLLSQETLFVRPESGDKALRDITRFAGLASSKVLRAGLPELRSAIQRKSDLVKQFLAENRSNKATLQELTREIAELDSQNRGKKSSPALALALSQLDEKAPQYFLHGEAEQRAGVQAAVAQLSAALAS